MLIFIKQFKSINKNKQKKNQATGKVIDKEGFEKAKQKDIRCIAEIAYQLVTGKDPTDDRNENWR